MHRAHLLRHTLGRLILLSRYRFAVAVAAAHGGHAVSLRLVLFKWIQHWRHLDELDAAGELCNGQEDAVHGEFDLVGELEVALLLVELGLLRVRQIGQHVDRVEPAELILVVLEGQDVDNG